MRTRMFILLLLACMLGGSVAVATAQMTGDAALGVVGKLPLVFVENRGQWDDGVCFVARQNAMAIGLERSAIVLRPAHGNAAGATQEVRSAIRLVFEGASPEATVAGERQTRGKSHFMLGNDPSRWHRNVPAYEQVIFRGLYDGVDVRMREQDGRLKYDVVVSPGGDLRNVIVRCEGAKFLSIDADGALVLQTDAGTLRQPPPVTWQESAHGVRQTVSCRYRLIDAVRYGFEVTGFDPALALVIDPGLEWSTYLGGPGADTAAAIAVAEDGTVVVAGSGEAGFPMTPEGYDTSYAAGRDAVVSCLDPMQTGAAQLVWSTYLGGVNLDHIASLALFHGSVDSVVVVGFTQSPDFPTTPGAYDTSYNGLRDAFLACLSDGGSALYFSTFLGTEGTDYAAVVGLGVDGYVTVGGCTTSYLFPTTPGAYDTSWNGAQDFFVTRLNHDGSTLVYSTFLGGTGSESNPTWTDYETGRYMRLVVGSGGETTFSCMTASQDYPTTQGAYDATHNGNYDAVVTRLDPTGSSLVFSTFLGGSNGEDANTLAVDSDGECFVAGFTFSSDFPTTTGAYDTSFNGAGGNNDVFIAWLDATGAELLYSSFLGGYSYEYPMGLVLDGMGGVVLGGSTASAYFPTTQDAYQPTMGGTSDAWLARMLPNGNGAADLAYSTFLGGSLGEGINDLTLDETGTLATCVGWTQSTNFPTSAETFDAILEGTMDGFVTRMSVPPSSGVPDLAGLTSRVRFSPPIPNPARDRVSYRVDVAQMTRVRVGVFDVGGRLVERLVDRSLEPGSYDLSWQVPDGKRRPVPGVYYLRLDSDGVSESRMFILLAP